MKIAVLGTGMVGQALAGRLDELGHEVRPSAPATWPGRWPARRRTPWATRRIRRGRAPHPRVRLATFADAAAGAELLVNATSGGVSMAALAAAGAANLAGKVLLDIANPLDFFRGFPPSLFVKDTDTLGEQIQATYPQAKVVKSLNTLTAALMVNPAQLADGNHSVFVSGNDLDAKKIVTGLLESFGHTDVIDIGDITTARGTEMLLPIWLRLMGTLNTPMFNFKIVR